MLPAAFPFGASKGGDQLFKQYKMQLKKKENQQAQREKAAAAAADTGRTAMSGVPSGVSSVASSAASSVFNSPMKQRPGVNSNYDGATAQQTPGGGGFNVASPYMAGQGSMASPPPGAPHGSPGSAFDGTETSGGMHTPGTARRSSITTPQSVAPRRRLTPEEINLKWKEIFAKMETWTAEDSDRPTNTTATAASTPKGSAMTSAATYRVTSYASAAAAQALYAVELTRYEQLAEGYALRAQQHARLVQQAQLQKQHGVRSGERKIVVPALDPPPSAPQLPPLTPFTPSIAAVDLAWRAELAKDPDALRGDALDHKALEGRLMDFLYRESHPLTLVKEAFVSNFLEAYSVAKNPALRGCTTNQASDLLLSNTLPTLLYFLDLLTKLLMKLFPELDAARNPSTLESLRQSSMESIFPSIFPTLFALYKRKYFFRDAELASKMSVLSSVGPGGCNLTLEDLGVSKYFCLDEQVVLEERVRLREKKRRKEREKRKRMRQQQGVAAVETEEQADLREQEEDHVREAKEAAALKRILDEQKKAAKLQAAGDSFGGLIPSPPHARGSGGATTDGGGTIGDASTLPTSITIHHHPISQLTHAFDQVAMEEGNGDIGDGAEEDSANSGRGKSGSTLSDSLLRTPPRKGALPQTTLSPVTSPAHHRSASSSSTSTPGLLRSPSSSGRPVSAGSPKTSAAMPILPPVTRLSPVTGFNSGSLSRSPRAEKIQDVLARSPSRRIAGSLATAPLPSPSNLSKSQRRMGLVPVGSTSASTSSIGIHGNGAVEHDFDMSLAVLDSSPARSKTLRMLTPSQIAASNAALMSGGESQEVRLERTTPVPSVTVTTMDVLGGQTPSPRSGDGAASDGVAKKQVGFFSAGPAEAADSTSPPAAARAATADAASPTPATSTPSAQPSSLGLALQQRRAPPSASASASNDIGGGAAAVVPTPPSSRFDTKDGASSTNPKPPPARSLGLGLGLTQGKGAEQGEESDDDEATKRHPWQGGGDTDDDHSAGSSTDNSPRMPSMDAAPVLGSSMPMLQGLPSSMLTHTPGSGSELLKKEIQRQREGKRNMRRESQVGITAAAATATGGQVSSPQVSLGGGGSGGVGPQPSQPSPTAHHIASHQPFVLHTNPTDLVENLDDATGGKKQKRRTKRRPDPAAEEEANNTTAATEGDASEEEDDDDDEEVDSTFPYQEAVILLRQLTGERTPRDKLQCLIAVSQEVLWCVDRFYARPIFLATGFRPKPEELCINADDLLSIVSFILLKSQLPNGISEAAFIDDFISRAMKLHLPGYFLATFQASIELITKLDRQKFLTREMIEQELRDHAGPGQQPQAGGPPTNGQPHGSPNASATHTTATTTTTGVGEKNTNRRPSYLSSHAGTNGALSSSLPRASSNPIDTASAGSTTGKMMPLPPGVVGTGSQPRPGIGIRHVQPLTLNAGQPTAKASPLSSRATVSAGNGTPSPAAAAVAPSAHLRVNTTPTPMASHLGASSVRAAISSSNSSNQSPSAITPAMSSRASTSTSSSHSKSTSSSSDVSHARSQSFHSSPGSRLESAAAEGSVASSSWSQPFTVVAEHFSNPNTPTRPTRAPGTTTTIQAAMGQMRGM